MNKQFINLLAACAKRNEDVNTAWKKAIGYAVNKAYRERNVEYVNAALAAAPLKLRPLVASAMRKLGVNVVKGEAGAYVSDGVRDVSKQDEVQQRIKDGDIADVLDAQAVAKPKKEKELTGTAAERVSAAVTRMIKRLRDEDPDAAAVLNDIWTARSPETRDSLRMSDGAVLSLTEEEREAVVLFVTARRVDAMGVDAQPAALPVVRHERTRVAMGG